MCLSPEQIAENIGDIPATAITCGPTQGASIVFYYQFRDSASMAAAASKNDIDPAFSSGPDCTASTPRFTGVAPYTIGSRTGVLGYGKNSNNPYLIWSDDRYNVIGMAFFGTAPGTLLDWWRHQAGPQ
jgi:hypothetical protein